MGNKIKVMHEFLMNVFTHFSQTKSMETLIICIEIFIARMVEMSIASVRTIMLVKGKSTLACILAFVEIIIWFFVAREALTAEGTNMYIILSYASGYAIGTYVGGLINKYFVHGVLTAFVVTTQEKVIDALKDEKYGVSIISREEGKLILLIEFKKQNMTKLKDLITQIDDKAFLIINESLHTENGYIH